MPTKAEFMDGLGIPKLIPWLLLSAVDAFPMLDIPEPVDCVGC